jgi:3'-phosphoadenosine 5'-phosphosulfate sulfotransferase (PAPS reductase)/FAD synthetase
MAKLIIKYQEDYIVEDNNKKYSLIDVPIYSLVDDGPNISLFIMFLCGGILDEKYGSSKAITEYECMCLDEDYFSYDYLKEIDKGIYLYDLDELINDLYFGLTYGPNIYKTLEAKKTREIEIKKFLETLESNLAKMPKRLIRFKEIPNDLTFLVDYDEDIPLVYHSKSFITDELKDIIKRLETKRTDNDVLLLYSGGKDSTLAAIRLVQAGYNVYLIHFDNGYMRDADKPYLNWKYSLSEHQGYYFPYAYSSVNIESNFKELFSDWVEKYGDNLAGGTIDSEIRCLACRSAMYLKAIEIAKADNFKYIADGARISQEFMLEQIPMTTRYSMLAKRYGIEVLYPVLDLVDDESEKQEIIEAGFSSKTWESKCLLGRSAMDKTEQDEENILAYFDNKIKPKLERALKRKVIL